MHSKVMEAHWMSLGYSLFLTLNLIYLKEGAAKLQPAQGDPFHGVFLAWVEQSWFASTFLHLSTIVFLRGLPSKYWQWPTWWAQAKLILQSFNLFDLSLTFPPKQGPKVDWNILPFFMYCC